MRHGGRSGSKRLTAVGPTEGLGHGPVEVSDEALDLGLEVLGGDEAAPPDHLADQDREPDLDLVEPRRMLGGEVEDDAVLGIAQKRLPARHRLQDAALALDPEILLQA